MASLGSTLPGQRCPSCFQEREPGPPCPSCGFHLLDNAARSGVVLAPGTVLGEQYVTGQTLRKPGRFGVTYLGWDLNLQVRVVVKEFMPLASATRAPAGDLLPISASDVEVIGLGVETFLEEARRLGGLSHPNVLRVLGAFRANNTAYLVSEYYPGPSLADHCRAHGGRLPPEQVLQLFVALLEGLGEVHRHGFIHGDVRPHNIRMGTGSNPVLVDFAAARTAVGERGRGVAFSHVPGYSAIEQYHQRGHVGPWTDLYGLCATAYRLLAGRPPPDAAERLLGDSPPPLLEGLPGLPPKLALALEAGLAPRPGDRVSSAQAMLEFLRGEDVTAASLHRARPHPEARLDDERGAPRPVPAAASVTRLVDEKTVAVPRIGGRKSEIHRKGRSGGTSSRPRGAVRRPRTRALVLLALLTLTIVAATLLLR